MNKDRRKRIGDVINELGDLRSRIESILEEEQDAYENMPEGLQQSDRGQAIEEAISNLDSALSAFDELDSYLNDAKE